MSKMILKIVLTSILLGLPSITRTAPLGLQLMFPEIHRQYSYVVKTNVSSGTINPSESNSYWTLEGRLIVQVNNNYSRIRFKLDELKTSVYSKNQGYSSYQSQEAADYLKKPWEVTYDSDGFMDYLYVSPEPVWTTNMKRAFSMNFQLWNRNSIFGNEACLYSDYICQSVYIDKGNTIKKYSSLMLVSSDGANSWSTLPQAVPPGDNSRFVPDSIGTTERTYQLDDRKGIESLDVRTTFNYKIHGHVLFVISELSFYHDIDTPLKTMDELNLTRTRTSYSRHSYSNPTNGIRNKTQNEMKNKTYEILLKIAKKGIDTDNIVRNANLIHNLDFIELLNTMSQLKYESLSKLFEDMFLGTSYDVETARNIFLEVLPHVRTDACARFVKYLVMEQKEKVEDTMLLSLIRKLPFNVANHSQGLLEELEVFTRLNTDYPQEIRHAAILSFASLVYMAAQNWAVKEDYAENIVVKYFRMYSDCPQYLDRLIWLQGLCNLGHLAESYTRSIYSDNTQERHERLWAGTSEIHSKHTYTVQETFLPILLDENEHIQLRISALQTFLNAQIERHEFLFLHNYIQNCNNNQLKRYWYTTVKSLEANKFYRGYEHIYHYAPFVANQVTNPDSTYWATNNYIITTENDGVVASLQVMSVGEPLSALPAFIGFKLSTGGRRPLHASAYIIAEGVATNMFKKLHTLNAKELSVDKLVELLKKMKVQIVQPEKVHMDLVIKVQDKTVYATHINQIKFESWNGEDLTKSIEDFLRFGSHINQQIVYYPFQLDINIPTELGTPIRLQSTIATFTSIRGNLTAPSDQDLTWRNDLHIRHQSTSVTSLSTDGPLLQSEHTTRIQQSMVAHLPMKFDVSVSLTSRSFGIKWPNPGSQHGGIAMHSRTQIAMESSKGTDSYTVTAGENKYKVDDTGIFFDCERPMTGAEVVEKLLTSKSNSYDFLTSLKPSLIILNSILLISSPTLGPCGLIIPPRHVLKAGDNVLELKFQIEDLNLDVDDKVTIKLAHFLNFRENRSDGDVYLDISGHTKLEASGDNVTLELLLVGLQPHSLHPQMGKWKICLQEQDISHAASDQDITTHPASYEGRLSLTYTSGDTTLTCPTSGSQVVVQYKGIPTHVYGNLERYLEVKLTGRQLPKLDVLAESGIGRTAWGQLLSNFDHESINTTAVVKEKDGVASVMINNGPEIQFKSENFAWLLDSWSNMQIMKKFGLYRECRLQESTVQTLSGSMDRLPFMECSESLVLADCTDSPRFAVQRLKHGGIKVYTGGNYVSVVGSGGGATVTVNGDQDCPGDCVYPSDEPIYDFKVSRKGDAVIVHSRLSGVQVYYRYAETVILVPHSYMTTACGACVGQHYYNLC